MAPIKTAILGAGSALSFLHYPSIRSMPDKFVVHSVLERSDKGRARAVCGDDVKVVRDIEGVVTDPDVELVVVASPNNTHYAYARAALEAGKHVVIEKPVCPTVAEARDLVALANSKGLLLSVYQNRRWDSDFLTVKKLVESEQLGAINEFTSSYDRYRPLQAAFKATTWKETAGEHNDVIYNLGSHIIDQAVVLFGMPEKVGCRCWDMRGIGVDECVEFVMDLYYPRSSATSPPLIVTVRASIMSSLPLQQRFLVKGSKGSFIKFGIDPQESFLKRLAAGEQVGLEEGYGRESEDIWGELMLAEEEMESTPWQRKRLESEQGNYPAFYAQLSEAISQRDPSLLPVQADEAVDVLRLIELGVKSSNEGRVLRLDEA